MTLLHEVHNEAPRGEAVLVLNGVVLLGLLTALCHGASVALPDGSVLTMSGLPEDVALTAVAVDPNNPGLVALRCSSATFPVVRLVGAPLPSLSLESHTAVPATATAETAAEPAATV